MGFLWASYRANKTAVSGQGPETQQRAWGAPVLTNLPNDESNLNTGTLPDGRVYLLNNPVFRPKPSAAAAAPEAATAEAVRTSGPCMPLKRTVWRLRYSSHRPLVSGQPGAAATAAAVPGPCRRDALP
jgi:hypothetical protein